jgi:co-chaperonin GroES (HSP10)
MSIGVVKGQVKAIRDHILVTDMEFDEVKTKSGLYIPSQDGKDSGIKPRWGRVWAIGPEQKDVKVGDWIYVDHGRWTRGMTIEDNGQEIVIRRVDNNDVLLTADQKPEDIYFNNL